MAALSVGQRAFGSVAEMIRALAPLAISAWMTGNWRAGVSVVPLVSAPVSPSCFRAARAPPLLHAVSGREIGVAEIFRDDKYLEARLQVDEAADAWARGLPSSSPIAATDAPDDGQFPL